MFFLIVLEKEFKINFSCNVLSFSLNYFIGFEENLDYLVMAVEFLILNLITLSVNFFIIKVKKQFQEVNDESNKKYYSLDNCFDNLKDAILILKKNGEIKNNKNFTKLTDNNNDENFLLHLKCKHLLDKKNKTSKNHPSLDYESEFKDNISMENFNKTNLFQSFLKMNIFNKIDSFNHNLTDDLIDYIKNFNEKINYLKIYLIKDIRKSFNFQNIKNAKNEKSSLENGCDLPKKN